MEKNMDNEMEGWIINNTVHDIGRFYKDCCEDIGKSTETFILFGIWGLVFKD